MTQAMVEGVYSFRRMSRPAFQTCQLGPAVPSHATQRAFPVGFPPSLVQVPGLQTPKME